MSSFTIASINSESFVIPAGAPCICCLPVLDPAACMLRKSVNFGPSLNPARPPVANVSLSASGSKSAGSVS